jgi:predicted DCC family thiol-disulfide oxidoreductase YuxK
MSKDTLLIDGMCGLCSRTGRFISNRQSKDLDIIEQQSEIGSELLQSHQVDVDSLVLIRKNRAYIRSSAAIRCLLYMRWNWVWIYPFAWIIPLPIRDLAYIVVAKLRK